MIALQWYFWFAIVVVFTIFGFYLGYKVGWAGGFHEAGRTIRAMNANFWDLYGKFPKEKKD